MNNEERPLLWHRKWVSKEEAMETYPMKAIGTLGCGCESKDDDIFISLSGTKCLFPNMEDSEKI